MVNTDINEATKVDYVTHCTLELHTGLKVGDLKHVGREDRSGSIVTDVTAGLFKLTDNVKESGLTAAELTSELCGTVLLCLELKESEVSGAYVLSGEAEARKEILCDSVGLGVNAGVVKDDLAAGDTKEARALKERLVTDLRYLEKLLTSLELTVLFSVLNYILCRGGIDTGNVRKKRVGCGVYVNAYTVYTVLNNAAEGVGESVLLHIVLILTYTDSLGLDLYELSEGILKSTSDGNSATLHNVELGELLSRKL